MKYLLLLLFSLPAFAASDLPLDQLKLPPGHKISVYARVPNARSMTLSPSGIVFVGTRTGHEVYAVKPNGQVVTVAKGLDTPNGVAFKDGDLYVAEVGKLYRIRGVEKNLDHPPKPERWGPDFPKDTHHGWKFIAFGPDGWLYVPVGAPCNICLENPDLYAALHKVSPDGKTRELVAKGIRNTVGFDWSPKDRKLWFTDNGRDMMGDDVPPCELNMVGKPREHFGYPHCHGANVLDPEFGKGRSCASFTPPKHEFQAHVAPLGMRFAGDGREIYVAEHGSWNRSSPVGYEVTKITLDGERVAKAEPFVTGFLQNGRAWGRPVDVQPLKDGSLLISDDFAGAIYRVSQN